LISPITYQWKNNGGQKALIVILQIQLPPTLELDLPLIFFCSKQCDTEYRMKGKRK